MQRFHVTNLPRSYSLTQQIWSLQQGSTTLSEYYTALKTLWDDLDGADCVTTCHNCACCKAVDTKAEQGKIIKFLAGLNESYAAIRGSIIMKKPIPELSEIYNLLDQDYSQRSFETSRTTSNASVFQVSTNSSERYSVNAATHGHQSQQKQRVICSHCGYVGHSVDKCYRIHGYPPGFKHKTKSENSQTAKPVVASVKAAGKGIMIDSGESSINVSEMVKGLNKKQIQDMISYYSTQLQVSEAEPVTVASFSADGINGVAPTGISFSSSILKFIGILTTTGRVVTPQTWIIDSGATHHVSHDLNLFTSISYDLSSSVTLPTGLTVKIAGVGTIKLSDLIVITNVLYIPDFRISLLSVSRLTKELKSGIYFDEDSCVIQDRTKGLKIGQGKMIAGLYVFDITEIVRGSPSAITDTFCSSVRVDASLWHNRLGHPSFSKIDSLKNVLGLPNRNKDDKIHCEVCQLAKQKHLPFNSENNMTKNVFDLVHIDTWGPFSVMSREGYRYFLTIVDDHSRATWVYMLKTKDEVNVVFPEFLQMVETQYGMKVKAVRSDNAPELKFIDLFKKTADRTQSVQYSKGTLD